MSIESLSCTIAPHKHALSLTLRCVDYCIVPCTSSARPKTARPPAHLRCGLRLVGYVMGEKRRDLLHDVRACGGMRELRAQPPPSPARGSPAEGDEGGGARLKMEPGSSATCIWGWMSLERHGQRRGARAGMSLSR